MQAWRLDTRVQVLRAPLITTGLQRKNGAFVAYGPELWAGRRALSDAEKQGNGQKLAERVERFRLRAIGTALQITPRDQLRLVAEGTDYDILAVKPGPYGGYMELTARARADLVPA